MEVAAGGLEKPVEHHSENGAEASSMGRRLQQKRH